jgi:type IV pilus assembly protein PilM
MTRLSGLFAPAPPTVAVEIGSRHVAAVRLAAGSGPAAIAAVAVEPLPSGAVVPALNDVNVADRAAVTAAVRQAIERTGAARRRAVLVIPDSAAKVSLLTFDKVPERQSDLAELIRWQTRKTVPFRIEEAQVSFAPAGSPAEEGGAFAVVLARRDIVSEYESICQEAGLQVGVVDLATFNLINATLAASGATGSDWLLVNAASGYLSLAILRGDRLVFFRHRGADADDGLEEVVHQTAMYYEDRLSGAGFTRVVLASARPASGDGGSAEEAAAVRRQLEQRLRTRVETVDPRPAVTFRDRAVVAPDLLDALTPGIGLLLRERLA